jgi:hypothetical protein
MSKPPIGRLFKWAAGIALVAAVAPVVPATITDDITPFVNSVEVDLWNPDTNVSIGLVFVTAELANGQTVTHSAPFRVQPQSHASVTVLFSATVNSVDATWINE